MAASQDNPTTTTTISEGMRRQFHRDGFLVVTNALETEDVEILRREADCLINYLISENINIMTDYGGIIEPITCGYIDPPVSQMFILSKKSYSHVRDQVPEEPDSVLHILFEKVPAMVNNFLPLESEDDPTCLFNEQYIVKTPDSADVSSFEWHQDSQYMDTSAQETFPIVSCWIALDNVNLKNGTLLVEPFPRPKDAATGGYIDPPTQFHGRDTYVRYHKHLASNYVNPPSNKMTAIMKAQHRQPLQPPPPSSPSAVGAGGTAVDTLPNDPKEWIYESQPPVLVEVPAGSIVFLSGWVRHCSLGNSSSKFRRAFMPQYSAGKVVTATGGMVSLAVPCNEYDEREREWVDPLGRKQSQGDELIDDDDEFGRTDDLDFGDDVDMED
ncbi:hypothetical protein KI688_006239 [Linnemannia hyalina]|uniref:Phytanoyl-CoA dioxygenase n=1 Tax=Linnemannia hyalina TaxID=64524 RepID=A0A9P7Y3D8_9FUNG|nr:hypothetical protein KI688_006239 [Linnemannia hyalina]